MMYIVIQMERCALASHRGFVVEKVRLEPVFH